MNFSRRAFAGMMAAGLTEAAFAQRAKVAGVAPADTVWLNGNEFPEGPPAASVEAMQKIIGGSNRYHYQEFPAFYERLAAEQGLTADQILVGAGSSEPLHAAVEAFTSPTLPLIYPMPTYEAAPELTKYKGHATVETPLNSKMQPDVRRLAAEAEKAGGGLIYVVNPNNPTSTITTSDDMAWLVNNLPKNTIVLVDEAYLHYATSPEASNSFHYVKDGKNVIVARTFSKIYGMAGLRVGYIAGRPDLIAKMEPYRNNVISIVSVRAVMAALDLGPKLLEERKAKIVNTRNELCAWLTKKNYKFIPPQANFLMIETGRDAKDFQAAMLAKGVAVGRPFPPLNTYSRVTIGTDAEMAKFRAAFDQVIS
jgi:histidinol-phosphate aminotransferase